MALTLIGQMSTLLDGHSDVTNRHLDMMDGRTHRQPCHLHTLLLFYSCCTNLLHSCGTIFHKKVPNERANSLETKQEVAAVTAIMVCKVVVNLSNLCPIITVQQFN
jgi:hypothetical protein